MSPDEKLQRAIAEYLETRGWTVLIASEIKVQHVPGDFPANYEFVLRFTGAPPGNAGKAQSDRAKGGVGR